MGARAIMEDLIRPRGAYLDVHRQRLMQLNIDSICPRALIGMGWAPSGAGAVIA